jgi:hypothetical protein
LYAATIAAPFAVPPSIPKGEIKMRRQLSPRIPHTYRTPMARKKRTLTATMADGYVKTITTAAPFTHYWRIVAHLAGGKTEVFWGHATSFREAAGKKIATGEAARQRGWERFDFEIVELTES